MVRCIEVLLAMALAAVIVGEVSCESRPDIGIPAGFLPECPGVTKNASISSRNLSLLQIAFHTMNSNGQIVRKLMPISTAHKLLAKEKLVDFKRKKTMVYAVGFLDSSVFPQSIAVGSAYVRRGYNVFVSETFAFLSYIYPKSARLSKPIGKRIGEFLVKLSQQGLSADDLELVGLSLGAHIVSYASKHFYAATGQKPSRITGLDPAGPCFRSMPPELRLHRSDAHRVDVIHTNIDGFGIAEPLGHVDFYANGGEFQPGDILAIPCLVVCSHLKAVFYWWQAVEHPRKFIGIKCKSVQDARYADCYNNSVTNYLGFETRFEKPGIYYLPTNNEFPYYRGKEGLKAENEIYTSSLRRLNSNDMLEV